MSDMKRAVKKVLYGVIVVAFLGAVIALRLVLDRAYIQWQVRP